jgi:DNA-binding response OmpR family regulator
MANILIIDDQAWVMDLCIKGLDGEAHQILATDDIEAVSKKFFLFKPSIVLLNQYLKHGFIVWDVLRDIKIQDQNLPLLIVTRYAAHLFGPRLSQADGYIVKSHSAADELKQKVSALLGRGPAVRKTKEIKKIHDDKISDQE